MLQELQYPVTKAELIEAARKKYGQEDIIAQLEVLPNDSLFNSPEEIRLALDML